MSDEESKEGLKPAIMIRFDDKNIKKINDYLSKGYFIGAETDSNQGTKYVELRLPDSEEELNPKFGTLNG